MNEKEVYLVATTDGKTQNVLARTFGEVIEMFGEENVWQIIRGSAFEEE